MATTIRDIMRRGIETIKDTDFAQQAAKKIKDKNVSSLVVVDENGNAKGIVSERDLVTKVCTADMPINTIKIKEIMSSPLITLRSRTSPSEAADMMLQHNVRHLLVVGDDVNTPVGIITPLDFTRYQGDIDNKDKDAIEKILEYYR
jgi:signal-transduction protein with cAMP-binding, CBS, and nucleotidyltransferase domain